VNLEINQTTWFITFNSNGRLHMRKWLSFWIRCILDSQIK